MNRRHFLQTTAALAPALHAEAAPQETRFLSIAEAAKPKLLTTEVAPVSLVRPVADSSRFLLYRMETEAPIAALAPRKLKRGDTFLVDFGRHLTGRLSFTLRGEGDAVDSPVRLRLVFGEAPADVAMPFEPYQGQLSKAWLPDEIINVDFLPRRVDMPRRQAFRWVKFEIIDTSPNFSVHVENIQAHAVSSAAVAPAALPPSTPEILRRIDAVSLATLRDCMQTVFEDGPRRDRRLWIGDLRLQALTNYCTFKNYNLVKRCLYLFAGLPGRDGLMSACVYDEPTPLCGRQYIMDYAALYAACVADYVRATGDRQAARDLWPVVKRQMEILAAFVTPDGVFKDPGGWWLFIDWSDPLDRTAPLHAVLLFAWQHALEVARLAGMEHEAASYPAHIERMRTAARRAFYDPQKKLFVSGKDRQVSWASQAWMALAGAVSKDEAAAALRAVMADKNAIRPVTPYLWHYVADAMLECGMKAEALDLVKSYWGSMVEHGADTFWEVYDPARPTLSPYGSILCNSYCHAWSCTPSYLIRARGLAG